MKRVLGTVLGFVLLSCSELCADGPPPILWKQQSHVDRVNSVVFSPDGSVLASGSSDRLIHLYRVSDGALLQTLNATAPDIGRNAIECVRFSPDASKLATCSYAKIQIWRVSDGALLHTMTNHTDWVLSLAFSPDGSYMASGSFDKKIFLWNTSDWSIRQTFSHNGQVRAVAYSSDNVHLATGAGDSDVRVWHVPDGPLHETLVDHWGDVESVAFSPNGQIIASGSQDNTIKLWDMNTATLIRTLTGHTYFVYSLAFSPDGKTIASAAGVDDTVKIWRVSDGALLANYTEETTEANTVAFSSTGLLAYGRTDGTVVVTCPDCPRLESAGLSGNALQLKVHGRIGAGYKIEGSTNFLQWSTIQTNVLPAGTITVSQPISSAQRFYRVKKNP